MSTSPPRQRAAAASNIATSDVHATCSLEGLHATTLDPSHICFGIDNARSLAIERDESSSSEEERDEQHLSEESLQELMALDSVLSQVGLTCL